MSAAWIGAVSGLVTLALTLVVVTFTSGRAIGEIRKDIREIKRRLGEIEELFVTRIRRRSIEKK